MNKYLSTLVVAFFSSLGIYSQEMLKAPRLVVGIIIDQFRTDDMERFASLYGNEGLKKIFSEGRVYKNVSYSFDNIDRSSAIASFSTGTSPLYNGIISNYWISRSNLSVQSCVDDLKFKTSPQYVSTTTIGDELKISTNGSAMIYGIAKERDAAVLLAGHAANGSFWIDPKTSSWETSSFYPQSSQKWIKAYNSLFLSDKSIDDNQKVSNLALNCIETNALGRDDITDYLAVALSAVHTKPILGKVETERIYVGLDKILAHFIKEVETKVGKDKVLFVLTSTGYNDEQNADYSRFNIPTGTFYINRTASFLNMFLSAIYGQGKYVEAYYNNQIYLNRKLIENKHLSIDDVYNKSKDFLLQSAGVINVYRSIYSTQVGGDIFLDITPGWKILNEDTHQWYVSRISFVPFPIVFYGSKVKGETINTRVLIDNVAPTIANSIHIRAPNACKATPLF